MATIEVPDLEGYECIGMAIPAEHLPCKFYDFKEGFVDADERNNVHRRICCRKIKPKRITFEFTGEIRRWLRGEHYYDHCGNFKAVNEDETNFEWPIYRIVELEK